MAYFARVISNYDKQRKKYHKKKDYSKMHFDIKELKNAYYLSKVLAYAQGFNQMYNASINYNWELNLSVIASIFRAGCIIQAELLQSLMNVFDKENQNDLFLSNWMFEIYHKYYDSLKALIIKGVKYELPLPIMHNTWIYLTQLNSNLLGSNMIQAQRDYFGAHTFERTDDLRGKFFHARWADNEGNTHFGSYGI